MAEPLMSGFYYKEGQHSSGQCGALIAEQLLVVEIDEFPLFLKEDFFFFFLKEDFYIRERNGF